MTHTSRFPILCLPLLLVACSTIPSGPSALVLPGADKNASQFQKDDTDCRKFAHTQLAATTHPPQSLDEGQLHFDITYLQCMYARGHLIPVSGEILTDTGPASAASSAPVPSTTSRNP